MALVTVASLGAYMLGPSVVMALSENPAPITTAPSPTNHKKEDTNDAADASSGNWVTFDGLLCLLYDYCNLTTTADHWANNQWFILILVPLDVHFPDFSPDMEGPHDG